MTRPTFARNTWKRPDDSVVASDLVVLGAIDFPPGPDQPARISDGNTAGVVVFVDEAGVEPGIFRIVDGLSEGSDNRAWVRGAPAEHVDQAF